MIDEKIDLHHQNPDMRKHFIAIAFILITFAVYTYIEPIKFLVDIPFDFIVGQSYAALSKVNHFLNVRLGIGFGPDLQERDPYFDFEIKIATLLKEKKASELINFSVTPELSKHQQEQALEALLKFDSSKSWINFFLNELPKGGFPGLYDDEAASLDKLFERIRFEGGIEEPLVKAYAESVFSFLAQHPNQKIRIHALKWISDVIPEEAVYIIANRARKESDPAVRKEIEQALWNIRVMGDPIDARKELFPLYQRPAWPSLRPPLIYLLGRAGYSKGDDYIYSIINDTHVKNELKEKLELAYEGMPFPRVVTASKEFLATQFEQKMARAKQLALMQERREKAESQDDVPPISNSEQKIEQTTSLQNTAENKVSNENASPVNPVTTVAPTEQEVKLTKLPDEAPLTQSPETETSPKNDTALIPPVKEDVPPQEVKQVKAPGKPTVTQSPIVEDQKYDTNGSDNTKNTETTLIPKTPSTPTVPIETAHETQATQPAVVSESVKPEKFTPKPIGGKIKKVDIVFEVIDLDTPLYKSPETEELNGEILAVGTKGKASEKVSLNGEDWVKVATKKGTKGWAKVASLTMYDLSPTATDVNKDQNTQKQPPKEDTTRAEKTYFEAAIDKVLVYPGASEELNPVTVLVPGVPYLAKQSQKVDSDRWFLLSLPDGNEAWARGIDLQLSTVNSDSTPEPTPTENQTSAFEAKWVTANVKGVGVFQTPSYADKRIQLIGPKEIFKVLEVSEGNGQEWYKIQLNNKKSGWVQTLDVSLTKPLNEN